MMVLPSLANAHLSPQAAPQAPAAPSAPATGKHVPLPLVMSATGMLLQGACFLWYVPVCLEQSTGQSIIPCLLFCQSQGCNYCLECTLPPCTQQRLGTHMHSSTSACHVVGYLAGRNSTFSSWQVHSSLLARTAHDEQTLANLRSCGFLMTLLFLCNMVSQA